MPELYHVGLDGVSHRTANPFKSKSGKALIAFCQSAPNCSVMHIGDDGVGRVYLTEVAAAAIAGEDFVARLPVPGLEADIMKAKDVSTHLEDLETARPGGTD